MSRLAEVLKKHEADLLSEWLKAQTVTGVGRDTISEAELKEQSREFLRLLQAASHNGSGDIQQAPSWAPVREMLSSLSKARAKQGFTPAQTATFVFSFKQPLFGRLREEYKNDDAGLFRDIWAATELLDQLGLMTTEAFQKAREEVIARQQQEMLELSTPVVKLWDGVLALPLIGTLDSARTQVVMESLLQKIVETGSQVAIIDITGVPTVDTLVAQHLIKTVTAARLMGADCIISGIRPQIAQTIVHLGVALGEVATKASLADAFSQALKGLGLSICRAAATKS
ncbi:MAG TPA: STAS domain-containing protein [Candidatus Nanoarchaeia archaeon]|nr:STAS domain-containing protein [Candidatus Nanoarchaeia archaeon]